MGKICQYTKIARITETSYSHRDVWAIGVTPQYTVGVWIGNTNGEGHHDLTGIKSAAPLLFSIFNTLPLKNEWF